MSNPRKNTTWDAENRRHIEPFSQSNADLTALIKVGDWNNAILVVKGNHVVYSINGHVMTDLVVASSAALNGGRLALQLYQGFIMDVRFKDLRMRLLN